MTEEKSTEPKKIVNEEKIKNEIKEISSNKFQEAKLLETNEINMDLKPKSIIKDNNNIFNKNQINYNTKSSLQIIKDINSEMDFISKKLKSNSFKNLNFSNNNLKNSNFYNYFNGNNKYNDNNNDYSNYNNVKNNDNQISQEEIQHIINKANEYINKINENSKEYNIIIIPNNNHKKYENKFCQSDEHYNKVHMNNYNNSIQNYNYSKENGIQNMKDNFNQNIDYKITNSKINSSSSIDTNIVNSKDKMINDLYNLKNNLKRKPKVYRQHESKDQNNFKYNKSNDIRNLYNNNYNKNNNNNDINNLDNSNNFRRFNVKGINKAMDVLTEKFNL